MSTLLERVHAAKQSGDWSTLVAAIPYAQFLGFSVEEREGELIGQLRYNDALVGNISLPALHGGTLGALLESTAIFQMLYQLEVPRLPKTITITVDYMRPGKPVDTFARATVTRAGRRVVNVHAVAWQEDRQRLVATANALFLVGDEGGPPPRVNAP